MFVYLFIIFNYISFRSPIHICHQDLSGFQCGFLDVIEMQSHAKHNYSKSLS